MFRTSRRFIVPLVVLALTGSACGASAPAREEVLADLIEAEIRPTFLALADAAERFHADVVVLCDTDSTGTSVSGVETARASMIDLRTSWKASEAMWLGPVMERRSWAVVDWPISVEEVEALIADGSIILDTDTVGSRIGADQRGLQAAEHVLFSQSSDDTALALSSDARRCDYLEGISGVMTDELALVAGDWAGEGPAADELLADPEMAIDMLVNDAVFLLQAMTNAEIGAARDGDSEAIIEGPGELGVDDIEARVSGLKQILHGLSPLLSEDLGTRISDRLDSLSGPLSDLAPPLRDQPVSDPEGLTEVHASLDEVEVLVATEVVSELGVTIGFSDADGDTGG